VSEAIKREAIRYGLDPTKAWVIRPAVDPNFFRPREQYRSDDETFQVVTTGSLIWRKGYEYALLAVRRLVDKGTPVRFDIIGDGPERQRILYTIHDLGLERQVHLYGPLAPDEVRDQLQQADVFLLSSLSEGISNAVLEAMACGLPIVTTDCGGMNEVVTDGVEGFLVTARDPKAMAQALWTLWENPALRKQMGQAGRQRIEASFTLSQQVQEFIGLCEHAIPKEKQDS
jgi:glycosyltransferase involved in cell wall biosynthesis